EDYKELLHTDTADINNMCNTPLGGSIAAALFLQQFAKDTDKWIHIDMANKMTPQKVHSYYTPGASGFGVRLLYALVLEERDRKSTRLNSSHVSISYAVFCLKKKKV